MLKKILETISYNNIKKDKIFLSIMDKINGYQLKQIVLYDSDPEDTPLNEDELVWLEDNKDLLKKYIKQIRKDFD